MSQPGPSEDPSKDPGDDLGDDGQLSGLLLGGRPSREGSSAAGGGAHLEREALLAKLFPTQVSRPRLGRYDVLEMVGEGGMGTVFAAYDPRLDRRVAVKLLRRAADAKQQRQARLLREAKALARLSHSNIVTVHEVWEEDDEIYIAMEFVQGQDLARWQRERRPWREVLDVYRQAGEGLAAVHDAGMVYRDFKPHNAIRRDADGVVKLLDFGLARLDVPLTDPTHDPSASSSVEMGSASSSTDDRLTRPGAIMGTPAYMAPEQRRGAPADASSDQFGFCVALWEALYGQRPRAHERTGGAHEDPGSGGEPGRPPESGPGVPGWVRRVLVRGLAHEPAERYSSMHALLRALARDPAIRRRRVLGASAVVLATVAGGLTIAELRTEPSTACVEVEAPWDSNEREAARQAVMGAAAGSAEQTWDLLSSRLDRHAQALSDARLQVCESHRRGLVPDEHHAQQVACLAQREAGFDELVERLGRADEDAVANANQAALQLPSPTSCTEPEVLLNAPPPPDDPAVATRVSELRLVLARAATEESVGSYEAAAERAATVHEEASTLGYAPLQAEALVRWGSARMQARSGDSMTQLDRALWLSLETMQHRVAAEAAAKRIYARVELQDRGADVSEAIDLARALANRPGAADWRIRWTLDNNIGIAHERSSRQREALEAYRDALAWIPTEGDEGAFERAITLENMGPVQIRHGQSAEAIVGAQQAIAAYTALFGSQHPQLRRAQASLASVLRMGGRFAEAEATMSAVLERYPPEPPPLWMLLEGARIAWFRGDLDGALAWCELARPRWDEPGKHSAFWLPWFRRVEARVAAARGDATGLHVLERMAEDSERFVLGLTFGRAEASLLLGRAAEAEALLEPLMHRPTLSEWDRLIASVLLGKALVAQGQWSKAQRHLDELVTNDAQQGGLEPLERAEALGALATAEQGLGRAGDARRHAMAALAALEGFDEQSPAVRDARATLWRVESPAAAVPHEGAP